MNFFLSKNLCGSFFLSLNAHVRRLNKCQVKRRKSKKYAGFVDVGADAAQSTHSVCLIRVFFVHFVSIYWAVSVK